MSYSNSQIRPLARLAQEFVELTTRLISFRSSAGRPEELHACADFICTWLERHSIPYRRLEHDGVPSVLAGSPLSSPDAAWPVCTEVLLLAHFDVVEGLDRQFQPEVDGNFLYGRGSIDDKYAVALSMLLYRELRNEAGLGRKAPLPFMLLFTGDEEVGGNNGAGYASTLLQPEFCLALDGGSPREVITRQKGVLRLALTEEGKSAHGARPWLGENAALKLAQDCLAVANLFQQIARDYPDTPFDYWHPTCNIGLMRSGQVVNQVPDFARADFDVRYTELQDPAELFLQVKQAVQGKLELLTDIPPLKPYPSPYLEMLLTCTTAQAWGGLENRHVGHEGAEISVGHGASDAQFFSRRNIPCAVWGAEGNNSQHGPEEHLRIDSAMELLAMLDCFLRKIT